MTDFASVALTFCAVWISAHYYGEALSVLLVLIAVLAVYKARTGKLNGRLFYVWFAAMLISVERYAFSGLFNASVKPLGYSFQSNIAKLLVWCAAVLAIVLLNLVFIYGVKRLLAKQFDDINQMGKAYPKIERFFIYNSIVILAVMAFAHYLSGSRRFVGYMLEAFDLFTVLALVIQLSFLILIFKVTWLKDNLRLKTIESQSLAAYSSDLERSMDDIRGIKHDIKNIFLTMGNFVERSGDADMQAFYREKISPFAAEEIAKSDLYGKLANIANEQMKAFMFYKISQAVERGISMNIDVAPCFAASDGQIDFVDLIRILGILLDNAIEECMTLTHGAIILKISRNDELVSYMVKNTVSADKRESGIKEGVTSKGDGRGRGLAIVRDVIEKYDCVTLNSYFQDGCFVQNLIAYRQSR